MNDDAPIEPPIEQPKVDTAEANRIAAWWKRFRQLRELREAEKAKAPK